MRRRSLLLVLWLGVLAAGGEASAVRLIRQQNLEPLTNLRPVRKDDKREWTVLYYLDGDNDLEGLNCKTLRQIEDLLHRVPKIRERVEIIILFDRSKRYTSADGDWTGTRLYRARPSSTSEEVRSELLADCGELNVGDPAALQAFLVSALKTFPAPRTVVVLDDHGSGWRHCAVDDDAPNAANGNDHLTLPEIRTALKGALQAVGREKFDLLIFDMCEMGQLEVAVACKDIAHAQIFSEAIVTRTYMWKAFLESAIGQRNLDVREIAKRTVEKWARCYDDAKRIQRRATLSAVDSGQIDDVLKSLNALLERLIVAADQHWATFSRALFFAERYALRKDESRPREARASIDLLSAIRRMKVNTKNFPAEAEYKQFLAAMKRCILASYAGFSYRRSTGLAIYAPLREGDFNSAYNRQSLAQCSAWARFLAKLHTLQSRHKSPPRFHSLRIQDAHGQPSNTIVPLLGHWCYFVLEGSNILFVNFAMGTQRKEGDYVIWYRTRHTPSRTVQQWRDIPEEDRGARMPTYRDGKSILGQELGGVMIQVASEGKSVAATCEALEDNETVIVRGLYSHPSVGTDVDVEIIFGTNTWTVIEVRAHMGTTFGGPGVTRTITPQPDGVFTPQMNIITRDGEPRFWLGDEMKWGEGLRLILAPVPPGEQVMFLEAESITGLRARARVPFKVRPNAEMEDYLKSDQQLATQILTGRWQWQTLQMNPQIRQREFRDWTVQVEFMPDREHERNIPYRLVWTDTGKQVHGIARLETLGIPILSFYSEDRHGNLKRELVFVPTYRPVGGTPAILLRDLRSGDHHRFIRASRGIDND